MTLDTYTKTVLTVIMICLTVLTLQSIGVFPTVTAASTTRNKSYGLVPLNPDGSITVRLNTTVIDVNIKQIGDKPYTSWSYGSPIPVKVKE